jgi:hypothetical protein
MAIIENGAGDGGFAAKVDGFNRLLVRSTSSTQEAHAVSIGVGFAATIENAQGFLDVIDTFDGYIALLKNTSSNRPILLQDIQVEGDSGLIIRFVKDPQFETTTGKVAGSPENAQFGANAEALATYEYWDNATANGIQGVTGGVRFENTKLSDGPFIDTIDGAIRVSPGRSLGIQAANTTGAPITTFLNIRFFFEG